jgi:hypothetical protein
VNDDGDEVDQMGEVEVDSPPPHKRKKQLQLLDPNSTFHIPPLDTSVCTSASACKSVSVSASAGTTTNSS